MRSSQTITLFSQRQELNQRSSSFAVSVLAHGAVISMLAYGILSPPLVKNTIPPERFTLRHLDLHMSDPIIPHRASGIKYPGPQSVSALPPGGKPAELPAVLRQTTQARQGLQTLVQPKIQDSPKLTQETPVPTIVLWTPEKTPVKAIVPPQPEKPTAAEVRPSLDLPNDEVKLADIRMTSSDLAVKTLPILPSTTSPIVVHGPDLPQKAPATTSTSSAPPTPATVLSLSDLRMKEGTVFLPPANESAPTNSPGALSQGQAKDPSHEGRGNPASNAGGSGAGQGASGSKAQPNPNQGAGKLNASNSAPAQGADTSAGDPPSTERISLPINGQFGAVVVGASLDARYPEASALWSGRLAYTVYLHLGLAKSWILQYSLPRSGDAASAGDITRIDAPWPYNIVRPNLAAGEINADALMVRGFVNQTGRFEGLAIVFPSDFPQAQFVIEALQQWQFRPATQGGKPVRVEVLLIIPDIE